LYQIITALLRAGGAWNSAGSDAVQIFGLAAVQFQGDVRHANVDFVDQFSAAVF
jgi:hypothetical protein